MERGEFRALVVGEWVLQPIENIFNDKVSFWLSRKGYTLSVYCFSCRKGDWGEYERQKKNLDSYKKLFESKVEVSSAENEPEICSLTEVRTYADLLKTEEYKTADKVNFYDEEDDPIDEEVLEISADELRGMTVIHYEMDDYTSENEKVLVVWLKFEHEYLVEVTETLQHSWKVKARDRERAVDIIESALNRDEIMVSGIDDFVAREVNISPRANTDGRVIDPEGIYDVYIEKV